MTSQNRGDVTVVIPCYNSEDTVGRAIRSVSQQTLLPREVVVVDDCSGPATAEALAALQEEYGPDWLRVIRLAQNGGPSVARNTGWDAAEGAYIAFLDADDSWHPRKLEVQIDWMEANPEVKMTGLSSIVVEGEEAPEGTAFPSDPPATRVSKRMQFVSNRFATSTVVLRASLPQRFEPARRYAEDNLLWLRIITDGTPAVRIGGPPMAYYHKAKFGAGGLSGHMTRMLRGQLDTCWRLWRESRISFVEMGGLAAWQLAKYGRRLLIAGRKRGRRA